MIFKIIKTTIIFMVALSIYLFFVDSILAEEMDEKLNQENLLSDQAGLDQLEQSTAGDNLKTPSVVDIQTNLDLLEKSAPVTLRLYDTKNLSAGSEVKIKTKFNLFKQNNPLSLDFKWMLKKDGIEQEISGFQQGLGKDQFDFIVRTSGYYEIKVQVSDGAGNVRESQPLIFPVGEDLFLTFEPLKPINGQKVLVSVSGFNNEANYKWYLDGQEQNSSSHNFEFVATKSFEQFHKVKVATTNKQGIVSVKEIIIPVYRPQVALKPIVDNTTITVQANRSNQFLVRGENPVSFKVETDNFIDVGNANYIWYVNGQKYEEGIGKENIIINPKDERLGKSANNNYQVSVLVSSPDLRHIAAAKVSMDRINPNSSLAAVNPEKLSNQPLVAQSKSFLTSFGIARKLIMPLMIVMFFVLIALGRTQPEKVE